MEYNSTHNFYYSTSIEFIKTSWSRVGKFRKLKGSVMMVNTDGGDYMFVYGSKVLFKGNVDTETNPGLIKIFKEMYVR